MVTSDPLPLEMGSLMNSENSSSRFYSSETPPNAKLCISQGSVGETTRNLGYIKNKGFIIGQGTLL